MKSIFPVLLLVLSASAIAKVPVKGPARIAPRIPITAAMKKIIAPGKYTGKNGAEKCTVYVDIATDSVTISIQTQNSSELFTVLNSSINYAVNATTGEISATQNLNFPYYLSGGSKALYIKSNYGDRAEFSISNILLDHSGNDASTYASCILTR